MARVIIKIDKEVKNEEDYIKLIGEVKRALVPIAQEEKIDNESVSRLMFALVALQIHGRHYVYGSIIYKLKGTALRLHAKQETRNEVMDLLAEFEHKIRNEIYKDIIDG